MPGQWANTQHMIKTAEKVSITETTPTTEKPFNKFSAGNLWLDNRPRGAKKLVIVINSGKKCIVCHEMITGKNTAIPRKLFNRGKRGYEHCGPLELLPRMLAYLSLNELADKAEKYVAAFTTALNQAKNGKETR